MQCDAAGDPDADRGDLALRAVRARRQPHPRAARHPPGFKAQAGAHADQRFLKAPNVIHHVQRFGQADHRVADQLSGAVPGDLETKLAEIEGMVSKL